MKKLFIYYSNTGNGDIVADYFKQNGYDIRRVTPKHDLPKAFFFKVFWGGFLATVNKKSKLAGYDNDITDYDEIVIGSPIWNGKLSCPINTVLTQTDFTGKKVSFVLYSGSGTAPKTLKRIFKEFDSVGITVLKEPKKHTGELKKLAVLLNHKNENLIPVDKVTIKYNNEGVIKGALKNRAEIKGKNLRYNINETLIVNRVDETIEYYRNVFSGNQISVKYHLDSYIQFLLEDVNAEMLFTKTKKAPADIIPPEGEKHTYEIIVEANGISPRHIKGTYSMESLPEDYADFICLIGKAFNQYSTWGYIFDPSIYAKPSRRKSDIIYLTVQFSNYGKTYNYITDDDSIEEYDSVLVPVGKENRETEATVVEKRYCKKEDVPYPLSKVKKVVRKISTSANEITPELIKSLVGKKIKIVCENYLSHIGTVNNYSYDEENDECEFCLQTEEENKLFSEYEIRSIEVKEE